jgi:hypothetical protein
MKPAFGAGLQKSAAKIGHFDRRRSGILVNILENFLFVVFLPKYLFVRTLTVSTEELYECLNDNRLRPHFPD